MFRDAIESYAHRNDGRSTRQDEVQHECSTDNDGEWLPANDTEAIHAIEDAGISPEKLQQYVCGVGDKNT
jgi:hypothetical protein